MKRILLSLVAIATIALSSFGQAPEGLKYKAVVRDAGNLILNNQGVGMRLTIQQGSIGGTTVYQETFAPTTNGYGLVNLEIGTGTTTDDFSTIDWSAGPYFIETAVDVTGGVTYVVMGTSQLMSVPYALYAKTSGSSIPGPTGADGADGADGTNGTDGAAGINGANGTNGTNGTDGIGGVTNEGTGISVTGAGTVGSPYVVSATSVTNDCGLSIGALYQGGIIFYLDASGCHGLISATTDQSTGVRWYAGTYGNTRARGDSLYSGEMNTAIIIAAQVAIGDDGNDYAAQLCSDYKDEAYGNWYLPSKYELNLMHVNLHLQGLGGFANGVYWSSTEKANDQAWGQNFTNAYQYDDWKNSLNYVRSVRAFLLFY